MKKDFEQVRQALEEHLTSINENTTEIQSLFDYLQEMDVKIEKFSERLDALQMSMGQAIEKPCVDPLDHVEKQIFLILYTEQMPISFNEISLKTGISLSTIPDAVSSLISKGVPLLRSKIGAQIFFKLSPSFKEMQAKENLINLSLQSFIEQSIIED